ncbi:hypothetical protein AMIS_9820 [Actinoplanes missouriensis 431]|uniref:DUF4190 domain-containing protein n=1 Tax=Actinoplanes missouriensis (strain ATCC 14538 / DSM 43046 / CBS 188.64 / JCM 3121 / NBRC 102363 / NCIMB 12654 / NRRL B-3342 / UNCC 431) TaxID=512565 RepID=I0GZL5_ACTM4|nr:DUF4190 domain-containing protein [Actinoplanes missouriensis]BAL86202.1 hypothetical protein AMIS_9820 [Actinoplanes missouriensis 431]
MSHPAPQDPFEPTTPFPPAYPAPDSTPPTAPFPPDNAPPTTPFQPDGTTPTTPFPAPESAPPTAPFPHAAPFPPQPYAPLPYEPQQPYSAPPAHSGPPAYPAPPVFGAPGYPETGYQQQAAGYPQPQTPPYLPPPGYHPHMVVGMPTSAWSVAALVLGICSLLLGWCTWAVPALLAVVFGHIGLAETKDGRKSGRGMAIAGLVMGYLVFLPMIVIIALGGIGMVTGGFATAP